MSVAGFGHWAVICQLIQESKSESSLMVSSGEEKYNFPWILVLYSPGILFGMCLHPPIHTAVLNQNLGICRGWRIFGVYSQYLLVLVGLCAVIMMCAHVGGFPHLALKEGLLWDTVSFKIPVSFAQDWKVKVRVICCVWLFATPMDRTVHGIL